jgi:hypothetical protein
MEFWVRNLVRKEACSFFLQKADGRFYPDFLCQLPGGKILAVEYKGADRWKEAEDDRLIGGLWAELSADAAASSWSRTGSGKVSTRCYESRRPRRDLADPQAGHVTTT